MKKSLWINIEVTKGAPCTNYVNNISFQIELQIKSCVGWMPSTRCTCAVWQTSDRKTAKKRQFCFLKSKKTVTPLSDVPLCSDRWIGLKDDNDSAEYHLGWNTNDDKGKIQTSWTDKRERRLCQRLTLAWEWGQCAKNPLEECRNISPSNDVENIKSNRINTNVILSAMYYVICTFFTKEYIWHWQ